MMKPLKLLSTILLIGLAATAGTITQAPTRASLGANDLVEWGTPADDGLFVSSPFAATSTGGLTLSAAITGGGAIFQQNGAAFMGNFTSGEMLLSTLGASGPITIDFSTAVRAVGFDIVHENWGAFTGTMQFFGAGNALFGSVSVNGISSDANDGSAPFLGGTSSLRDITRVVISVDTVLGGTALAINQVSLVTTEPPIGNPIPEPTTITLFSVALAGCAWLRRRRA